MVYCQDFLRTWKHFLGTTFSTLEKMATNNFNQLTKNLPQNRLSTVENDFEAVFIGAKNLLQIYPSARTLFLGHGISSVSTDFGDLGR
jgi:hypothetical protein